MALKRIDSLDEIIALARTSATPIFVRWSTSPATDARTGRSYNHQTGAQEAGLSVNNLLFAGVETSDDDIALQLTEYRYLRTGRPTCKPWLLTGTIVGYGSDGEPLVTNIVPLALVGPNALAAAEEVFDVVHGFRIDAAGRVVDEHGLAYSVSDEARERAARNTERIAKLAKKGSVA